jgi:E3 ubiquitin-protein ligase RGLG
MESVQEDPLEVSILKTQSSYDIQELNSDNYEFLDEVQEALKKGGLGNLNLIVGIDYTFSNTVRGKKSFGGENLHHQSSHKMNPYQSVLFVICKTLEKFDKNSM